MVWWFLMSVYLFSSFKACKGKSTVMSLFLLWCLACTDECLNQGWSVFCRSARVWAVLGMVGNYTEKILLHKFNLRASQQYRSLMLVSASCVINPRIFYVWSSLHAFFFFFSCWLSGNIMLVMNAQRCSAGHVSTFFRITLTNKKWYMLETN